MTHDEAKALTYGTMIYHNTLRNADGTMLRARCTGRVRLWKRRPDYYEVPMKHGLRDSFYITPDGAQKAADWSLVDTMAEEIERKEKLARRSNACRQVGLPDDVPDGVLRDALMDKLNFGDTLARIVAFVE